MPALPLQALPSLVPPPPPPPLTLQYELAVGSFPYPVWKNMFEQLKSVVDGEAPRVPDDLPLSGEFKDFIHKW